MDNHRHVETLMKIGERHLWKEEPLKAVEIQRSALSSYGYAGHKPPVTVRASESVLKNRSDQDHCRWRHYDTVPGTPGADDNASGLAGLLELAVHQVIQSKDHCFCRLCNEEPPVLDPFIWEVWSMPTP
jgi:hypothetical protein